MSDTSCLAGAVVRVAGALAACLADPRPASADLESMVTRAAHDLTAETAGDGAFDRSVAAARWSRLRQAFELTPFEMDLVAVAALADEHELLATVLAAMHPRSEPASTAGLAAALLVRHPAERSHLRHALLDGNLARHGIVRVGSGPLFNASLGLAPGLWEALHGHDGGARHGTRLDPIAPALGLAGWLDRDDVDLATRLIESTPAVIVLNGDGDESYVARAAALVRAAGAHPVRLVGDVATRDPRAVGLLLTVRGEVPVLAPDDLSAALLDTFGGPLVVVGEPASGVDTGERPLLNLPIGHSSIVERVRLWDALLPGRPDLVDGLASTHRIDPVRAGRAVTDALTRLNLSGGGDLNGELLATTIRQRAMERLPAGVRLVTPRAGWDDLVVDDDARAILLAATDRARHHVQVLHDWGFGSGRAGESGVRLLFAGPPGTGKTLAAEVLATELGLDLLVVDLAAMVSKWLGETEKNLAEVFDVAERTQALLFFDEADSLFARRTDVNDAHSRWANLETAYLLGRLERFDGVVVLATNLRANIDGAFVRRLEFVCEFHEPECGERELLWERHLSSSAPRDDVDIAELALLYPITGGLIKNAALAAGFLAAADGGAIGQQHVVAAVRREYEKAGRSFPGNPRRLLVS